MAIFFWVCFGVGVGYTVISFALGEVFSTFDLNADVDSGALSFLKPAVIAAFATVFGGAGLLLMRFFAILWVLPLAATIAALVAYILYRFVIMPLSKAQNTSTIEIQSLIGHSATVTGKILQGSYGQITYTMKGNTFNSPAKAEDGGEIAANTPVEIIYIQDNTYYVRKK